MKMDQVLFGSVLVLAMLSEAAQAAEPVTNTLTAQRVVLSGGTEHLESAGTAKPGDVIVYTIQFKNAGSFPVHALEATLPIPAGVALLPGSVQPAAVRGSLDGKTFAPLPLMHRVVHADGSTSDEAIPTAQIRYLRWQPAELAANGSLSVSARVVLQGTTEASTAP